MPSPRRMLRIGQLLDDAEYVIDLQQFEDGTRAFWLRGATEPSVESTVFSTIPVTGAVLREALSSWDFSTTPLVSGMSFGMDAHGVWLTKQEWLYMNKRHDGRPPPDAKEPAPWVNGKPPRFPPK